MAQGKIALKPLITHRYEFKQAKEAFQAMVDQKGYDGKPRRSFFLWITSSCRQLADVHLLPHPAIKCIISSPQE